MGLRKGQKELVEQYRGGFCAVPAIPGGGKTHCLSLWAAEMIANRINRPGKILIVTYMNSAVNNFKQRISKELGRRGIVGNRDYFVSTIHGLCVQIIKEKPDLITVNEDFQIIDPVIRGQIIGSCIDEWRKRNDDKFRYYIDDMYLSPRKLTDTYNKWREKLCNIVLASIGDFKAAGFNPASAKAECGNLSDESILKWASEIYELYDKKLKISGYLDFDDMLYKAKSILIEDKSLLQKYRDKYSFVCEDEAQDSNLIQSEILGLIANGNFLRVGDSNQAICGSFTSSDFKLFKNFCDNPDTTVFNITESSRNTKNIISLANYFVRYVRERHPVPVCRESLLPQFVEPVGEKDEYPNPVIDEYGIRAEVFTSWEEEARWIVKNVAVTIEKFPDKTIAVLVPSAWKMGTITTFLNNFNIPFEQFDNTSSERNKTIRILGRIIDFIATPENAEKFANMLNECFLTEVYPMPTATKPPVLSGGEIISDTTPTISSEIQMGLKSDTNQEVLSDKSNITVGQREIFTRFIRKFPTEKLIYPIGGEIDYSEVPKEISESKIWADFIQKLDLIRELLEFPATVVEKLILHISEKLDFCVEERAIAQKVASDVRMLMSGDPAWGLANLALELLNPKNMFNHFAGLVWDLKGYEPTPGVVTICTYHKSKGLEWNTVFLSGLNNSDFPVELTDKFVGEYYFLKDMCKNPQALAKAEFQKIIGEHAEQEFVYTSKIETISEKARLLYVGITRAKEYLYLSGFEANKGKKSEVLLSMYLDELKKYTDGEREMAKC